jgi:hypothetical protein
VHEEPAGSWHIVLPAKPADAGELSDADLEKVARGITPVGVAACLVFLGVTVAGGVTKLTEGW